VNFKIIKTREHNIYVGVILFERVKMVSTRRESDAISYKLKGNELWEDKVKAQVTVDKINPGDILSLLINGRRKIMQWWRSGKLIVERALPFSFQER
jgi:hypothetical protein